LLLGQKPVGDDDGTATLFEDQLNFGLGESATEAGLAFFDLGVNIRGKLVNNVALLRFRKPELNRFEIHPW
jgi:hypothetical protein